jgi:hypothetical protein
MRDDQRVTPEYALPFRCEAPNIELSVCSHFVPLEALADRVTGYATIIAKLMMSVTVDQ